MPTQKRVMFCDKDNCTGDSFYMIIRHITDDVSSIPEINKIEVYCSICGEKQNFELMITPS